MTLGQRLRGLRGATSLAKAAYAIDERSDQWLANFEADRRAPSAAALGDLANHYGLSQEERTAWLSALADTPKGSAVSLDDAVLAGLGIDVNKSDMKQNRNTTAEGAPRNEERAKASSGATTSSEEHNDTSQTASIPSRGDGGDAMEQAAPTDPAAWMRVAQRMMTLLEAQNETARLRIEQVEAVQARAQADLASAAKTAVEKAAVGDDPRSVAGTAAERRESESGDDQQLSAESQQAGAGGGRAAG